MKLLSPTPSDTEARSDRELVAACLADDPAAWDDLVERYQALVYSVPARQGLGDADCDDVFQNVFVKAYRKLETLQDHQCLAAWLLRTAYHEACGVHRRRRRQGNVDDFGDIAEQDPREQERQERQMLVRQALDMLGGRCSALLTALFESPRPDYEQIAQRIGIPAGSIGPTRARCFKKLEKILRDLGVEPETSVDFAATRI